MHWQCAACGELIDKGVELCPNCGAPQPEEDDRPCCPNCDAPLEAGAVRCPFCGIFLGPDGMDDRRTVAKWSAFALFVLVGLPAGLFGACAGSLAFSSTDAAVSERLGLYAVAALGVAVFAWLVTLLLRQIRR